MPSLPFRLAEHEKASATWASVSRHLNKRLDQLRTQLEGFVDAETTAQLRGRIAEIKSMLDLAKDLPIQPPTL